MPQCGQTASQSLSGAAALWRKQLPIHGNLFFGMPQGQAQPKLSGARSGGLARGILPRSFLFSIALTPFKICSAV